MSFTGNLGNINLEAIEMVTLTKWVRSNYGLSLRQSLDMAKLLKESYRLGMIRGQSVIPAKA